MLKIFPWRSCILLLALLFAGIDTACAQNKKLIDSLERVIANTQSHDTLRVEAMCLLSQEMKNNNPSKAIQLTKDATVLSRKISFLNGEALSLNNTGNIYYEKGKNKDALEYWFKSIAVYKKMCSSTKANIKSAGVHGLTDNLISVSRLYCDIGELKNFEKHVEEAKEIMKNNPTEYSRLGWVGIQWAGCYYMNGKYDECKVLYLDALESFSKSNYEYGIANTLANLGMLQNKLKQPDSALIYFNRSLNLYKKVNSLDGQSWVNNLIGGVYKRRNKTDSALHYFKQAYANSLEANNVNDQASSLTNMATALHDNNQRSESIKYMQAAYDLAVKHSKPDLIITTASYLSEFNEKNGDYKRALTFLKEYLMLNDSLNNNENIQAISKLESQYDFEKEQAKQASIYEQELNVQKSRAVAEKKQQKFILIAVSIGLVIVLIFSGFLYNKVLVTRRQKHLIALQKEIVVEKNKEILDSIAYAKRIQAAVLPAKTTIKQLLPDSFIFYKPKDIVAGDFYWLEQKNGKILVAAADCTGHGVPGAMVSVICNNGLNRSVREHNITDPDEILNKTREIVINEFEKSDENVNDGMDIALISFSYIDTEKVALNFSGAHNALWVMRKNSDELEIIPGDKQPIGKCDHFKPYQKHERVLTKGDIVYLFTDGYKDQFGGNVRTTDKNGAGKKYKTSRLKKLILSVKEKSMQEQKQILETEFENWRGNFEQVDDVCMIGIRL